MHPGIKSELHKLSRFQKFLTFYGWISKWLFGPPTIVALVALVACAIFPVLFPFLLPIIIPTGLIAIGSLVLNSVILKDPDARFRRQFYQKLCPAILQSRYESFDYVAKSGPFNTRVKESSIIGLDFEYIANRVLLQGTIGDYTVGIARLFAEREIFDLKTLGASALLEIPNLALGGESILDGDKLITVYNGIMIEIDLPKTFPSAVIVAPQAKWKLFKDAYTYRSEEIVSSDVIFNDRYIAWTENAGVGQRWLSNNVTSAINGFSDEFGCELFVCICKSKLYIGYEPEKTILNCIDDEPLPNEQDIELFFARLDYIMNAVEAFQHSKRTQ